MKHIIDNLYVGKSYTDQYCLLLHYPNAYTLPAGRSTKGISLKYYCAGEFIVKKQITEYNWAVVSCLDHKLEELFTVLSEGVAEKCANKKLYNPRDILEYIMDWQELLASVTSMTENQLRGLWGELFFILNSNIPERAVSIWEGPNKRKFDFSNNGISIEVKTSVNRYIHTFSHEQLQDISSEAQSQKYIYSLYIEEDFSHGKTINELVTEIKNQLPRIEPFQRKLLSYGYQEGIDYNEERFLIKGLKLVNIKNVPKVITTDIGVFNLKYKSDLTFCTDEQNKNKLIQQLLL